MCTTNTITYFNKLGKPWQASLSKQFYDHVVAQRLRINWVSFVTTSSMKRTFHLVCLITTSSTKKTFHLVCLIATSSSTIQRYSAELTRRVHELVTKLRRMRGRHVALGPGKHTNINNPLNSTVQTGEFINVLGLTRGNRCSPCLTLMLVGVSRSIQHAMTPFVKIGYHVAFSTP